jgi:hypothetical protein
MEMTDLIGESVTGRGPGSALVTSVELFPGGVDYPLAADRDAKQTPDRDMPRSPPPEMHQVLDQELYSNYRDHSSRSAQFIPMLQA